MIQKKLNILIVEDDPAMRVYTRAMLVKSHFEVGNIYEAENGRKGLEVLGNHDINFILTDINMPEMGGIDFMERVNNHPIHKNIPVVAITTESGKVLMNMLAFWGHGYIQKPFNMGSLEKQLSKFYGKNNEHYYLHG